MIKILGKLPKDLTVAVSGGVDSMAVLDFLSQKHNVQCVFFNHNTETSNTAEEFLSKFCNDKNIKLLIGKISEEKNRKESLEEHWRIERYKFLTSIDQMVVTAHNLEDVIETWIWSSLHGTPKLIPYRRNNIVRPFLSTSKKDFINWCQRHSVEWKEDTSNQDTKFIRNYIRHELMPHALKVNPGLNKLIMKKIIKKFNTAT